MTTGDNYVSIKDESKPQPEYTEMNKQSAEFVVKHTDMHKALVFGTVKEALDFVYQALDIVHRPDETDHLHSLLNFGKASVDCYRISVHHPEADSFRLNSVLEQLGLNKLLTKA